MRGSGTTHLVLANLAEQKGRTLTAACVIALAVGVVMFVAALAAGFVNGALRKAEEAFPPTLLTVRPKALNLAMLSFHAGRMDDDTVEAVAKMEGVAYAAPQAPLRIPLHATGNIMGQMVATDAVMLGVGREVLADELPDPSVFAYDAATSLPVPCVLPRFFLDMYNLAYAESQGLPKINESFALGKDFTLHLGMSYFTGTSPSGPASHVEVPCRIVGLTGNPALFAGVLIPLEHARELNRLYAPGGGATQYNAIHVKVDDARRVPEVAARVDAMGFAVDSRDTLQKLQFVARAATLVTVLFALVVVAIAAASVFNTFSLIMAQRRGEVGLLRAVGGTRRQVARLFMLEVGVIGLAGGAAGVLASWALLAWADRRLLGLLPEVSFLPDHLFHVSPLMAAACVAGATALSVLATLPVIRRTTHTPPATLVSEA